jgi:hypothetical protein
LVKINLPKAGQAVTRERMFTSGELNKHRVLEQGAGHFLKFVST